MSESKKKSASPVPQDMKSNAPQGLGKKARDAMIRLRANDRAGSQKKLRRELGEALDEAFASGLGLADMENRSFPHMWEELVQRTPDLAQKWAAAGKVSWQDTGLGHALRKSNAAQSEPWEGLSEWLGCHAHLDKKESIMWMKMIEGDQFLSSAKKWMDWAPESEECKEACLIAVKKVVESALPIVRMEIWGDVRPLRLNAIAQTLLEESKAVEAMAPLISEQVESSRIKSLMKKWSGVMRQALEGGDVGVLAHVAEGMARDDALWAKRRLDQDSYRQMKTWFEVAIAWDQWDCVLWLMDQGGHEATLEAMDAQASFAKNIHAVLAKECRLNPEGQAAEVARRLIMDRAKRFESKGMEREQAASRAEDESAWMGARLRASKSKSAFEQLSLSVALDLRAWVSGASATAKKVERNAPRL